jgi:hypothetical protein
MFSVWSFQHLGPQIRRERNAFECIARINKFRLIVSSAKIKICYFSFLKKKDKYNRVKRSADQAQTSVGPYYFLKSEYELAI